MKKKSFSVGKNVFRQIIGIAALYCFMLVQPCYALVVLQYHHVSEKTPASTSVSPERFAQHMQWLQENHYQVLSMSSVLELLTQRKVLPDKAVLITFDDGYLSIYENAWPILKKYDWPFTVFINSQPHDQQHGLYMSWEQMKEMAKSGVTFGNHSETHAHLIRTQEEETNEQWKARILAEIINAQTRIDSELGAQPKVFAYPFGEHNIELESLLKQKGYVAFSQQSGAISSHDNLQSLPRYPFGGPYGEPQDFALKAKSLPMPLEHARLETEDGKILKDPLLPSGVHNVHLILTAPADFLKRVKCFYAGRSAAAEIKGNELIVKNIGTIPVGRSRFNCTSPENGRFYWYSKMLIKKNSDGSWYAE